jgi:hypothetical protein
LGNLHLRRDILLGSVKMTATSNRLHRTEETR